MCLMLEVGIFPRTCECEDTVLKLIFHVKSLAVLCCHDHDFCASLLMISCLMILVCCASAHVPEDLVAVELYHYCLPTSALNRFLSS